ETQTQDDNGVHRVLNETFVDSGLNVGETDPITGSLDFTTENPLFATTRQTSGLLASYSLEFDQYDENSGTYTLNIENFVHNSGDPNFNQATDFTSSGVIAAKQFTGLTGAR